MAWVDASQAIPVQWKTVGVWTVQVLLNGASIGTKTFNLTPLSLLKFSGDAQSVFLKSVTQYPLKVRVMNPDLSQGISNVPVDFKIANGSPKASASFPATFVTAYSPYAGGSGTATVTVNTDSTGVASIYFNAGDASGTYQLAATSKAAPNVTVNFTVTVSGTNPLANIKDRKNLGEGEGKTCPDVFGGNPINTATGNKFQAETDYVGIGPFPLRYIRYYNSRQDSGGVHGNWNSSYGGFLSVWPATKTMPATAALDRPDGKHFDYTYSKGSWVTDPDNMLKLETLASGDYKVTCASDIVEIYDSKGRVTSISSREGFAQTLTYPTSGFIYKPVKITDAFGRSLNFTYNPAGWLIQMQDPAGRTYNYSYDWITNVGARLTGVEYPDQVTRQYLYENSDFPNALTGIIDENGDRFATWTYDEWGRAISSEHAGGAERFAVTYNPDATRVLTDGNGTQRNSQFSVVQGVAKLTSIDNGLCATCGNLKQSFAYDTNGFVSSTTDYNGVQTTYVRNTRGLETSRTEAVGKPEQRIITTTWHATYNLPLTITEPGRSVTFTYDTAGRMLTRTEKDTAAGTTRVWTYQYNGQGLLASIDGPRTDATDVTRFAYDGQGNLTSVTNALGQVTAYTAYTAEGKPLSMQDPNGVVTNFGYDVRGRLASRTVNGISTLFTYDNVGQLKRITSAAGSWIERSYDPAHRLIGIADNLGNRIDYTLDSMGNVLRQETVDPTGTLATKKAWAYDQLNRVFQEIDASSRTTVTYTYDGNGNTTKLTNALSKASTLAYDGLNRLIKSTDPLGGVTAYVYDARDNVTKVTDPLGAATTYVYDGLNNKKQIVSPDAGTTNFTFDAAGNVKTKTWANGKSISYTYDALNRVTRETYADSTSVQYTYDSGPFGVGHLTSMTDATGTTQWSYNELGNIISKQQVTGGKILTTTYQYDSFGRLQGMTYPSGRQITYGYTDGKLSDVSLDGTPLISSLKNQPFGAPQTWTFSNGKSVSRTFDLNGQLTGHPYGAGTRTLTYDVLGRIIQVQEPQRAITFGYDDADRLTSENVGGIATGYTYDLNGNRRAITGAATSTYTYTAGTNRLQNVAGAGAKTNSFDAAGNITNDGQHMYTYGANNRLSAVDGSAVQYGINGIGQRVRKTDGNGAVVASFDEAGLLIGEYDSASVVQETVYIGAMPVAVIKPNGTYFIDADQLNSPRSISNATNQEVWRWDLNAFGSMQPNEDPSATGTRFEYNLRFPGQYFDKETKLHYNYFRDYDPSTGRYVESDPLGLAGGLNTYAYVDENPTNRIDPLGLGPFGWVVNLLENGGMKIGRQLADKADAVAARKAEENVLVGTRQAAKQVEDAANGGAEDLLRHSGHDLRDGSTGLPHYQTDGKYGHTFWRKQGGSASVATMLGELFLPFGATASGLNGEEREWLKDKWERESSKSCPAK
jgi:RHS repeat-associated protein